MPCLSVLAFSGLSEQKELGELNLENQTLKVLGKAVWSTVLAFAVRFQNHQFPSDFSQNFANMFKLACASLCPLWAGQLSELHI